MGKYLKHISLQCEEILIPQLRGTEFSFIGSMYEFYLKKVEANGYSKVILSFSSHSENHYKITELIDIIQVQIYYEVKTTEIQEENRVLNLMHEALIHLAETYSWKQSALQETYNSIILKESKFHEYWKKSKFNRNRNLKCSIYWEFDNEIKLYFTIHNQEDESTIKQLFTIISPGLGALEDCLGEIKWINNWVVILIKKNSLDFWKFNTKSGEVSFHFERAEKGDAHGQYDLAIKYLTGNGLIKNSGLGMYYMKKSATQNYSRAIKYLSHE